MPREEPHSDQMKETPGTAPVARKLWMYWGDGEED